MKWFILIVVSLAVLSCMTVILRLATPEAWPILYPLQSLPSGKYSIEYLSTEGNAKAGTIEVP